MNYKNAFCFLVSLLLTSSVAMAQQAAPAPPGSPGCRRFRVNLLALSPSSLKAAAFSAFMPRT